MNFKSYFSNLSCWEEFEMKCGLLGKKKNDSEILQNFRKTDSFYYAEIGGTLVFLDQEGNKTDVSKMTLNGNLYVYKMNLTSLKGCPKEVGGNFDCSYCDSLTSLEGAPEKIGGSFGCSDCASLSSLKGAPKKVGEDFICSNCKSLTSLEGAPREVGGVFSCLGCYSLTSLEGAPREIGGSFDCGHTKISNDQKKTYLNWLKTYPKENYKEQK